MSMAEVISANAELRRIVDDLRPYADDDGWVVFRKHTWGYSQMTFRANIWTYEFERVYARHHAHRMRYGRVWELRAKLIPIAPKWARMDKGL